MPIESTKYGTTLHCQSMTDPVECRLRIPYHIHSRLHGNPIGLDSIFDTLYPTVQYLVQGRILLATWQIAHSTAQNSYRFNQYTNYLLRTIQHNRRSSINTTILGPSYGPSGLEMESVSPPPSARYRLRGISSPDQRSCPANLATLQAPTIDNYLVLLMEYGVLSWESPPKWIKDPCPLFP
jgi:hypothetical protein